MFRQSEDCLRRIAEIDAALHAWVEVAPQPPLGEGPLAGVPFGVKDVLETRDMATEYGSALYAGRKGACDGAIVTELRRKGAILLGKTHTAAFAYFDPAPTRNPRDPRRTPGGSSSGSAAAVAAGMAAFAVGTQTQGSILRPASYCGVVGFKPTFGAISTAGVLPFAPSLDTVGFFTETCADMLRLVDGGEPAARFAAFHIPAEPEMDAAFGDALSRLRAGGFLVHDLDPPPGFAALLPAARLINDYEGARTHHERWRQFGDRIGRKLAELVRRGLALSDTEYQAALETVRNMRKTMAPIFQEYPVVLSPAAPGRPPLGLESTGDPRMNAPWTALGGPAISIPMPVGSGLPLGMQMTGDAGRDAMLVTTAVSVESCWSES